MDNTEIIDFRLQLNEELKDPEFKKEYDNLSTEFTLAKEIMQLRKMNNLTQKELAEKIGTSQPSISRIESGSYRNISLSFLRRIGEALNAKPEIHLKVI